MSAATITPGETKAHPFLWRVDYGTVRRDLAQWLEIGRWPARYNDTRIGESVRLADGWTVGTRDEALACLGGAFRMAASQASHGDIYVRPRRRMRWSDDGDLDVSQALAGADFPFARWDPRPKKPGLSIAAELDFHAGVDNAIISAYGAWLAGELARLETEGYDLDVSVIMPGRGLYEGYRAPKHSDIRIILKRENEASDFRSWSAMFSPIGFRMLGFTAMYQSGLANGWTLSQGLGSPEPQGDDWSVLFNADTRSARINVPLNPYGEFPAERMTEQLMAALPERGA